MRSIRQGFKNGIYAFLQLCSIMIPVYFVVAILKQTDILDYISDPFAPLMVYFGLPGGSALAVVTGNFVNIYAALAVLAGLQLTTRQVTILAIMLGISHSQVMETAIVVKMKAHPVLVTVLRVLFSLAIGFLLNLMLPG